MSRFRPAMSAPRRPTNATSPPSAAIQAAMLAPEPPPCMVTFAGVSLPRASGSVAWATASVIRSPMTTTRAILVITSSPATGLTTVAASGPGSPAAQQTTRLDARVTRSPRKDCHRTVTRFGPLPCPSPGVQRQHAPGHDQFGLLRFGRQHLVQPPELVPEQPPGRRRGHHAQPGLVAHRDDVGTGLPPRADQFGDPARQLPRGTVASIIPGASIVPRAALVQYRGQPAADPVDQQRPAGGT